ncbi:helix-hairpin-helix domain-containing protein [Shewanella sp. WXL01]|uniref:ComEA family DNA-binding protein n=1 Tax=Shewanella sp. WXL01 TaxID=2709721 RepID=UPI00143847D0|nr:helix-hairpin-helix domain-containing protein [Shewanella sp. WXL01]NKF51755.1 helix-hairpin-helix domain-containing protein [Shewanella sp. WXL01]
MKSLLITSALALALSCAMTYTASVQAGSEKQATQSTQLKKSAQAAVPANASKEMKSAVNDAKLASVNINKASVAQLQTLKGIGEAKAKAIVEYRKAHGKFKSKQELTQVKGIGEKLIAQNAQRISL